MSESQENPERGSLEVYGRIFSELSRNEIKNRLLIIGNTTKTAYDQAEKQRRLADRGTPIGFSLIPSGTGKNILTLYKGEDESQLFLSISQKDRAVYSEIGLVATGGQLRGYDYVVEFAHLPTVINRVSVFPKGKNDRYFNIQTDGPDQYSQVILTPGEIRARGHAGSSLVGALYLLSEAQLSPELSQA